MSRFILKVLAADIPKVRRTGSGTSSPVPIKRHRAIIAVNQREPSALANNYRNRLHISFRFVGTSLMQCLCQPRQELHKWFVDRYLALLIKLWPSHRSPGCGTGQSRLWDGSKKAFKSGGVAKLRHLCRVFDLLTLMIRHGLRRFDDSVEDRFPNPQAL